MRGKRLRYFVKPSTGEKISFLTKQYYVFPDGRIWNHEKRRFLKQHEKEGYMHVVLTDDNRKKHTTIRVHNIVVSCFVRLLENGEDVHHIDHDRKNNNLSNLEIIDGSEHKRQHSLENWSSGRMDGVGEKLRKAWSDGRYDAGREKVKNVGTNYRPAKQVAQLDKDGRMVRVWPSTNECGRNGFDHSNVSACCRGCYSTHRNNVYKGYKWQWYEDYLAQQPTVQEQFEARQIYLDI